MADFRITQSATYTSLFDTHSGDVLAYIEDHPACSRADVVSGTGKSATIVATIVELLDRIAFIIPRPDETGAETLYTAGDWVDLLRINIAAVETWIANNNNGLLSDMVDDLSIPFAVGYALLYIMQEKAVSKMTAVI